MRLASTTPTRAAPLAFSNSGRHPSRSFPLPPTSHSASPAVPYPPSPDTGIIDDLNSADLAADLDLGDGDVPATYDDFVQALGRALLHRASRRPSLPTHPRGHPVKPLKDLYALACNDFDAHRPRSNANRMSLAQFVRLCDGALPALSRRHSPAAAAVVFARCRRGADERLSFDNFVAAMALVASETGKTFEAVAAAAAAHAANGAPAVSPDRAHAASSARRRSVAPKTAKSTEFPRGSLRERGALRERGVNGQSDGVGDGIGDGIGNPMSGDGTRDGIPVDGTVPTASSALERSASNPSESSFASADRDGDGLLSPDEVVTALLGTSSAPSERDDASDLVATLFEDVDLDRDGRVCFSEYEALCKKITRALRRRTIAVGAGAGDAPPVPPEYFRDAALERAFAGYCRLGAPRADRDAKHKHLAMDERRFLRLLADAKLAGGGASVSKENARLRFARRRSKRVDFRGFVDALAGAASHAGTTLEEAAKRVRALPDPDVVPVAGSGGEPSFMAPIASKTPARPASARFGSAGSYDGFAARVKTAPEARVARPASARPASRRASDDWGATFIPPARNAAEAKAEAEATIVPAVVPVPVPVPVPAHVPAAILPPAARRITHSVSFADDASEELPAASAPAGASAPAPSRPRPRVEVPAMSKPQSDAVAGVFRATRAPDADGVRVDEFVHLLVAAGIPSEAARRAFVRVVANANDPDADADDPEAEADLDAFVDAVAETAAETDETFFRVAAAVVDAAIRMEEEKEAAAAKEEANEEAFEERRATTRVATRTAAAALAADAAAERAAAAGAPTRAEKADVEDDAFETSPEASPDALSDDEQAADVEEAADDEAPPSEAPRAASESVLSAPPSTPTPASPAASALALTPPSDAPATPATPAPPPPASPPPAFPPPASPPPPPPDVPEETLRVWRSEFDAHDESGVGRVDVQSLSFALAKLRLLEDVDVEQAARTLESELVRLGRDPAAEGGFDFDAFRWFASALVALRESPDARPSAKPVPVRREFVFDDAHPFAAYFARVASNGEIDGETFAARLRDAGLVDGTILSDTGVDVVFARARARHVGGGRKVPYRIYLGALSLTAGHVGLDFAAVVERLTATVEATVEASVEAPVEASVEASVQVPVEAPVTPVERRAAAKGSGSGSGSGKKKSRFGSLFSRSASSK